ncbi:MAG: proline--tRNA ligase, partial [Bacilli bacterium]|nr:proline--tRNA ligase [Bacilli bacterium]
KAACGKLLKELEELDIRAEVDNSDHTPGWKFAEAEMKGIPLRIEIGPRDLENGKCVLAKRVSGEKITEDLEGLASKIPAILKQIHEDMYEKACKRLEENTKVVSNMDELKAMLDKGGYAKTMWCGDRECEDIVKEKTNGGTSRCMPFDQTPVGDRCVCCGKPAKKVIYFAKAY